VKKVAPPKKKKVRTTSVIFKKLVQSKQVLKGRKFAQSGHPGLEQKHAETFIHLKHVFRMAK
jgi:hypothetical protein